MDLIGALASGATPLELLVAIMLGTAGGLAAGLMPGVSGRIGLLLVTPLAIGMGATPGAVFLVAFHAVVHTSGSIPAILLGAPTSSTEAATAIDGYAMTRKGEGARAVGASLAASVVGGVFGACLLLSLAPVALGAAQYIGAPEMAALSLLGLLSIAALAGGDMAGGLTGGLVAAALGMVIASVGLDVFTSTNRFTLGLPELSDGINVATIVTGLFVVPELVAIRKEQGTGEPTRLAQAPVLAGFVEALDHRWLLVRTSLLGWAAGMAPGLGASVSVWLAYSHARQSEPSPVPYGEGAIAGVIAPEAANNAKEGGALAPTLFFGVPSSSGMGILLAAFVLIGVEVGPRMLISRPDFVYLIGLTVIVANLLAIPFCLMILPGMTRLATVRSQAVAPVALAAGSAAVWLTEPLPITMLMIAIFSGVGLLFKAADMPRAPLLLGFVLAPNIESGVTRSMMIQGFDSFARPGVLLIVAIALVVAVPSLIRSRRGERKAAPPPTMQLPAALALSAVVMAAALAGMPGAPFESRLLPGIAAIVGLLATAVAAWRLRRIARDARTPGWRFDMRLLALLAALLAAIPLIGAPAAAGLFVIAASLLCATLRPVPSALLGAITGGIIYLLGNNLG